MALRTRRPVPFRSLGDLEEAAAGKLSASAWGYVQGGAGEELTLRANRRAFDRWNLRPRVLEDVRTVELRTTLLGQEVLAPLFVAPTARHREIHRDGERGMARAASHAGVLSLFSTLSSDSLEAIARAAPPGPRWFQLYLQPEVDGSVELLRRAERAGFSAWVATVDTPVLGYRDRQIRSGFAVDGPVPMGNGPHVRTPPRPAVGHDGSWTLEPFASASWEVLDRLREATRLPLVVKGVLTAEDARRSLDHGARAVIVSNHGGRQLDRVAASLDALPEVAGAVQGRAEVYLDGGVRRASDILIALALGARAVGLGRPPLWALAVGGERGVARYLELLTQELATSLAVLGRRSVRDVAREDVALAPGGI